jgi:hypothetical protein
MADGSRAGSAARGIYDVNFCLTEAINASDGTRTANLATPTYAGDFTGDVNVSGVDAYYHDDNQGQTATDGANDLFSGGIFVNDASWTFWTIQTVVPGSGVKQLRILALDVT